MSCAACSVGLYEECLRPTPTHAPGWIIPCGYSQEGMPGAVKQKESRFFDPAELTDDTSAGRKRAVVLAPILAGMRCEWEGLKFAGGGPVPILGCRGNRLANAKSTAEAKALGYDEVGHVHHGPDKSVINNAPGTNLHRICTRCHNRWHAANDAHYDKQRPHPSQPYVPNVEYFDHDPLTVFTDAEFGVAEKWWAQKRQQRGDYPFKPDHLRRRLPMSEAPATVATANPFEEIGDSQ